MASLIPASGKKKMTTLSLPKPVKSAKKKDAAVIASASNDRARLRIAKAGESDPTKKKGPSSLERIFGVLGAPGVAVKTALHDTFNSPADSDLGVVKETTKSLKGQRAVTGADLLADAGVDNKWAKLVGGFLVDVVTDPVTYLTFGTGSAAKTAGTAAVGKLAAAGNLTLDSLKSLGLGDDILKAVAPYADDAGKIVAEALDPKSSQALMQGVYKAMGDKGGVKFAGVSLGGQDALANAGYKAKSLLRKIPGSEWAEKAFGAGDLAPIYRDGNEVMNAALTVARRNLSGKMALGDHLAGQFKSQLEALVPDEAERSRITIAMGRQLKDPENATAVRDALTSMGFEGQRLDDAMELAESFREGMAGLLTKQRDAGVDVAELGIDSAGYIPGVSRFPRSKSAAAGADDIVRELGADPADLLDPASPQGRTWRRTLTPDAGGAKTRLTPEDRILGLTREGDEAAGLSTELDAARLGGYATQKAEANVALAEYGKELKNILGENIDAEKLMKQTEAAFTNDEATKGFLRAYDKVLNSWKVMATSLNIPQFPMRNGLSNKYLAWTENLLDPATEQPAARLVKAVMTGKVDDADRALVDELIANRVFTNADEIAETVGGATRNRVVNAAGKVNEFVENQARTAAYLAAKKQGLEPAAASMMVDKALYNYDRAALTSFERNFMRRIVPFYTWQRRNTPHMVELLLTQPRKIGVVGKLQSNAEAVTPEPDESGVMPDWMRDTFPIPLPMKNRDGNTVMVSTAGVLPVGDLEKLNLIREGKVDVRDVLGSISPLIKLPMELAFNKDVYYGDEIKRFPGEKRRAPGYVERADDLLNAVSKDLPEVKAAWDILKESLGIATRKDATSGEPYLAMDATAVKVIRDLSPWLNNMGKIVADAPRSPADRLTYFTGVKTMAFDTPRFARQQVFDEQGTLQAAMARLRAEGRLPDPAKPAKKPQQVSLIPKKVK